MAQQPPSRQGFDFARLSMGTKAALIVGILAFINFFLPWNNVGAGGFALGSISGFNGIGTFAAILVIALLVWEGINVAGVQITAPTKLITAALAAGAALFTILRFLVKPGFTSYAIGSWIGLILGLALGYVAWINWQEHQTAPAPPPPPAA